ncbi:multiple organellar RNA editing factor 3, mitochondrial-like [Momordica charantia]|uniref:Multiple organellar RNA editing factor 3, mitochondrial-like n=1 Tax=Momordica charantia TaxID=3673 RepID=A0A6J1DFQ2_MOMCH|nr:multiple organellar RNA editing factor 3, mitochondrial-like [Momordica charantia]
MASSASRRTLFTVLTRTRSLSSSFSSSSPVSSRQRFAFALMNRQDPIAPNAFNLLVRFKTSGSGYSPLNDPSPNWSNRPPKETILLDGCDYEHWLIVLEFPNDPKPSEEEMVNSYVKTLAAVVGSEEEAKKKIYSVCTTTYTGFGALISEELSYKVKELPGVLWVLPDSYLDVPNKDYGGDLFIDGKVIPRPQYRYNERQQTGRNRPRPRYDRRRETMQVERRQPIQRQSWGQDQRDPVHPLPSIDGQNTAQSGVRGFSTNLGDFNRSNS